MFIHLYIDTFFLLTTRGGSCYWENRIIQLNYKVLGLIYPTISAMSLVTTNLNESSSGPKLITII